MYKRAIATLALLTTLGCGQPEYCEEGTKDAVIFDQQELGRRQWDGDSFWLYGRENKVRLLGVDYPNISGRSSLEKCATQDTEMCDTWKGFLGSQLDMKTLNHCYEQGMNAVQELLEEQVVCLIKDSDNPKHPYGNDLWYMRYDNGGGRDVGAWLLVNGFAIPSTTFGECNQCDEYREIADKPRGCLAQDY